MNSLESPPKKRRRTGKVRQILPYTSSSPPRVSTRFPKQKPSWWTVGEIGQLLCMLRQYGWYIQSGHLSRTLGTRSLAECTKILDQLRGFKKQRVSGGKLKEQEQFWLRLRRLVAIVVDSLNDNRVAEEFSEWWSKDLRFFRGEDASFWKLEGELESLKYDTVKGRWEDFSEAIAGNRAWIECESTTRARASLVQYRNLLDYMSYVRDHGKSTHHEGEEIFSIAAVSPRALCYLAEVAIDLAKEIISLAAVDAVPRKSHGQKVITKQDVERAAQRVMPKRNTRTLANDLIFEPWNRDETGQLRASFPTLRRFVTAHTSLSLGQLEPECVVCSPENVFDEARALEALRKTKGQNNRFSEVSALCGNGGPCNDDEGSIPEFLAFLKLTAERKNWRATGCVCYHRLAYIVLAFLGYSKGRVLGDVCSTKPLLVLHQYAASTEWLKAKPAICAPALPMSLENIRNSREELLIGRQEWSGTVGISKTAMDALWSIVDRKMRETAEILALVAEQDPGRCFIDLADVNLLTAVLGEHPR